MIEFWRLPSVRLCLALLAGVAGVDVIGAAFAPYQINSKPFADTLWLVVSLAAVLPVFAFVTYRMQGERELLARVITFVASRMYDMCALSAVAAAFAPAAALMSALAATTGFPMQDALFSSVDQALGLDWPGFVGWLNQSPARVWLLLNAYHSAFATHFFCVMFLIALARTREVWELAALVMLTTVITISISLFVPAIGGYTYYGADESVAGEFMRQWPQAGTYYVAGLLKAHSGQIATLDIGEVKNVIQFPSFHGILALLLIYRMRNDRWLFWPFLVINTAMFVSAVPVGGHHFADLMGSIVVFLVAVAIMGRLDGRPALAVRAKHWIARIEAGAQAVTGPVAGPVAALIRARLSAAGIRRRATAVPPA